MARRLSRWPRLKQVPLRLILILVFTPQVLGVVGLIGYLSFRNGQKAVTDLASQLRQELTARIERELQSYFETPHEINRLNAAAFARGELDVLNAQFGEWQFYQQMRISKSVALIYCGAARSGEFLGVLRSPDDGSLQFSYSNADTNFLRDYYLMDVNGDRTFLLRRADRPYDSRQRPWFQAALSAQTPIWTDVYIAFTTGLPNITASLPVYNQSGRELLGVCATDVVLSEEFRAFLQQLEIGSTGQAFVVDRQGSLIANSIDEPLMVGQGSSARLLAAVDSQDALVRGTAQYLTQRFDGFENIAKAQQLDFELGGDRQFLEVLPFRDGFGLDWLIVVVVPEADFMAQIHTNTRNTILLCLLALGIATGISVLTARWIARPILNITQASQHMAQGDLDQMVAASPIAEIDTLAGSFNSMTQQLQDSFAALQQSEATNRAIVNAIPDLLIRASRSGDYLDIVGRDRLKGVFSEANFFPGSHVTDSLPPDLAALRLEAIQEALNTGSLQLYEQRLDLEGAYQDEEVRITVLGQDEVLIMVRDITSHKQAEEALRITAENYRSIYENAVEGIFRSSPDGHFIGVNPAMARIYGYSSPAEMVEQITDIATQVYVNLGDRAEFQRQLEAHDQVQDFECPIRRKNGSIIWVQEATRAVRDNSGKLLYYEGIVQDITERKHREDELKRQLEELQVEIDHSKREREVAQITGSDYFQNIRSEIEDINLDEFWNKL